VSEIRRNGFYVSNGELEADLSAVAAPIRAESTETHSALALVTSSTRYGTVWAESASLFLNAFQNGRPNLRALSRSRPLWDV
jgi:DNA-binding IclR family transcriptional regulator